MVLHVQNCIAWINLSLCKKTSCSLTSGGLNVADRSDGPAISLVLTS